MKNADLNLTGYPELLKQIKARIRKAQIKAALSANAEMILMYRDIGKMVHMRQQREGWGSGVIPKLSRDIRNELPGVRGFSERNIGYMIRFSREYDFEEILQQPVAELIFHEENRDTSPHAETKTICGQNLQQLAVRIPWGHHILLMEKVKDLPERVWYMQQTIEQGWSRNVLRLMIESGSHRRQGLKTANFEKNLPDPQSDLALQTIKDPYIFDFLTITEPFQERELETELVRHLEKFLLEMGRGFAFLGRQYHIEVAERDFYIDLLFYHIKLRCFVVIELKKGPFKPEYAGKMNFYCSVVDDLLKHESDHSTIGLILCQENDRLLAEYSLRDVKKPIGVSRYELTSALPEEFKSSLPTVEEIEAELGTASKKT